MQSSANRAQPAESRQAQRFREQADVLSFMQARVIAAARQRVREIWG
jgi:hypothetical protein